MMEEHRFIMGLILMTTFFAVVVILVVAWVLT